MVLSLFAVAGLAHAVGAEEEQAPNLLSTTQLEMGGVSAVAYYACPRDATCAVRCGAGAEQVSISYSSVVRLEIGDAPEERMVGIVYLDPEGRARIATAFFPKPSGCALDDLVMEGISPVEEGTVIRPTPDRDVVFEVERAQ